MLARYVIFIFSLISSSSLWAEITCYYTLVKDNCWIKYDVSVDVMDAISAKTLTTVTVPIGKSWTRQTFPCQPGQKLMYRARFSPIFWESDAGKTYIAKNYWSLPNTINPGDSAWNVTVCYSSDFSLVPLPPNAPGNCSCNFDDIPAIPLKKI
ncbi:hypothetical protein OQJ19_12215 [Fluoribacter gormanii]|uniref:Periplasmic protein n=1 Tax=Fluoribacter gormanii TaxID=464 RepID=A0A377GLN3_9GAMM|nr:hypothetical protein [Fluoribacter gormanii]KTD01031.1 periplasmic protein [Fluoribacter gormanii]MCW8442917.1 hypothetical protein [Fluoribacter gormanii]MCW8471404.1 hypothetical protein [Fluoribacter gormanii]SIR77582.1 hypothetical protein SAMN05421777_1248 [Fluoribacter gormanii]STO25483.1 Uncharacterised protein [Fluoribacter gormanii]